MIENDGGRSTGSGSVRSEGSERGTVLKPAKFF